MFERNIPNKVRPAVRTFTGARTILRQKGGGALFTSVHDQIYFEEKKQEEDMTGLEMDGGHHNVYRNDGIVEYFLLCKQDGRLQKTMMDQAIGHWAITLVYIGI